MKNISFYFNNNFIDEHAFLRPQSPPPYFHGPQMHGTTGRQFKRPCLSITVGNGNVGRCRKFIPEDGTWKTITANEQENTYTDNYSMVHAVPPSRSSSRSNEEAQPQAPAAGVRENPCRIVLVPSKDLLHRPPDHLDDDPAGVIARGKRESAVRLDGGCGRPVREHAHASEGAARRADGCVSDGQRRP